MATWTRTEASIAEMRKRIRTEPSMAHSVVTHLYMAQTPDERAAGETIYDNRIGFNQADAPILTPLARTLWLTGELDRFGTLSAQVHCEKYAEQYLAYLECGPTESWENDFRVF